MIFLIKVQTVMTLFKFPSSSTDHMTFFQLALFVIKLDPFENESAGEVTIRII